MIMDVQEATTRRLPDLKGRHLPENCREAVNAILKRLMAMSYFVILKFMMIYSKEKKSFAYLRDNW